MRRADRLFATVQLVRGRRLSTAAWLAQQLQVLDERFRDKPGRTLADLQRRQACEGR